MWNGHSCPLELSCCKQSGQECPLHTILVFPSIMITLLTLVPVFLIAGFAMYLQYRMLSKTRQKSPLWRALCVLPVLTVVLFLLWAALRS